MTSLKTKNKTKKIKSKNSLDKYKICKNNICIDSRVIKHSPRIRNTKYNKTINKYYFLCLNTKKLYTLGKRNFNKMKNHLGYLINIEYNYFINKPNHKINTMLMYLMKSTKKEMDDDPSWAEDAGLSLKTPFSFGYNNSLDLLKHPKSKTIKDSNNLINNKRFENYIKKIEKEIEAEFKKKTNIDAYQDTYENLLDKYYNFCKSSDVDVFKIKYYA